MMKTEKVVELKADAPIDVDETTPFTNDLLDFESSVTKISSLLPRLSTPFTVGIYGEWGAGKTSFMKMLSATLSTNHRKNTFWFNAWEYENDTSLMLPLLSKLAKEFKSKSQLFESIKKIAASVVITGADVITKIATLNTTDIKDVAENIRLYEDQVGESYERWISDIDSLRSQFKALVQDLSQNASPFYIFIDDLDRCLPENIIKLIENIKHFLTVDGCNCVFILGIDKSALTSAIKARYGTEIITGDEYLEKIINISFHVPIQNSLMSRHYIKGKLKAQINDSWFVEIENDVSIFSEALSQTGIKNPRKIKILISRYLLFIAFNENKEFFMEIIVTLIIYREFFPDAYKIKKERGDVNYFPSTRASSGNTMGHGAPLTFDEVAERSCRGFAVVNSDDRYKSLRYFQGNLGWLVSYCFDKSDAEAQQALDNIYNNPPKGEGLIIINRFLQSNFSRNHKDYFDAVDFIFSLS